MTTQSTIDKLIEMRLTSMSDAFRTQMEDPRMKGIPFEDRFGMLVDIEYSGSTNLSGDSTALSGVSSLFTNFSRKTPYFSGVSLKLLFSLVIFLYHQCFPKSFCYKWCLAPLFLFQTNPVKLHASMVIPTSLYVILLLVT